MMSQLLLNYRNVNYVRNVERRISPVYPISYIGVKITVTYVDFFIEVKNDF